jgi:hypothetical protein
MIYYALAAFFGVGILWFLYRGFSLVRFYLRLRS